MFEEGCNLTTSHKLSQLRSVFLPHVSTLGSIEAQKIRTHSSAIPELMALRHIPKLGAVPPGWSLKFHCDGRTLPKCDQIRSV